MTIRDEIFAVTEDFAEYIARRGRGITVATPARRELRLRLEKLIVDFLNNAPDPDSEASRPPARLAAITAEAHASEDRALVATDASDAGKTE